MLRMVTLVLLAGCISPAMADAGDQFHVTDAEKAACTSDAVRFCYGTYPDETKLLSCMKQNRSQLSNTCRVAFDAGVKRRRL